MMDQDRKRNDKTRYKNIRIQKSETKKQVEGKVPLAFLIAKNRNLN